MRLQTARLEIRLPRPGEGIKLATYYRDNQKFLQPFYPLFTEEDFSGRGWESTLPHVRSEFETRRSMRLILLSNEFVCGVVNLTHISRSPRYGATLGYSLAENAQGKGLMTEALKAILPFAFQHFHLHRIQANYMPRNLRSGKTLAGLGFEKEGLAREYLLINGIWEDHVLTAKINEEWT